MPKTILSHDVLPECASILATLTEEMRQVTLDQVQIAKTIYGNSKPGIKENAEQNSRDIVEVAKLLKDFIADRKEETAVRLRETELREFETKQRKSDILKWWLGLFAAIVLAVIAIARDISTQALIASFGSTFGIR